MPESNTPNSTDGSGDEGSQNPESPPKLRLSLRKPGQTPVDQVPEEKPPPPTEPEKVEEPPPETPAADSGGGGKLKLTLGSQKADTPKEEDEKSEEESLAADPFDIKPEPVEGGPSLKLGSKPQTPEAEEKPKTATPPPARKKKKSGITIRGLSSQPFEAETSPETEINGPAVPAEDNPVVENEPPPPEIAVAPPQADAPPPVVKAPPPVKKPAPPPPGKKKVVPAPPPKAKVKLAKPAKPKGKEDKAPPPPDKKKKAKTKPPKTPKKTAGAKASPKKMILAVLFVGGIFLAAGYFAISAFIGTPPSEAPPKSVTASPPTAQPPPTATAPSPPTQPQSTQDADESEASEIVEFALPAPQPSITEETDISEAKPDAPIFQFAVQETVAESEPMVVETATATQPVIFQPAAPEQDPNIIALVDSLVIKGSIGDGNSARILVGNYKYDVGDFIDENLGVRFSGINKSSQQILFTDNEGAIYYKSF